MKNLIIIFTVLFFSQNVLAQQKEPKLKKSQIGKEAFIQQKILKKPIYNFSARNYYSAFSRKYKIDLKGKNRDDLMAFKNAGAKINNTDYFNMLLALPPKRTRNVQGQQSNLNSNCYNKPKITFGEGNDKSVKTTVILDENQEIPERDDAEDGIDKSRDGQVCKTVEYDLSKGNLDGAILNPSLNTIFPGQIYEMESFYRGGMRVPTNLKRNPISLGIIGLNGTNNFSNSTELLKNGGEFSVLTIDQSIRDILYKIENPSSGLEAIPTIEEIHSLSNISMAIGAAFAGSYGPTSVNSTFNSFIRNTSNKHYYLYSLDQVFYAATIGTHPSEVLSDYSGLDLSNIVMVSNVKYGRRGLVLIETELSETEITAGFNLDVKSPSTSASGKAAAAFLEKLSKSKVSGYYIGGNSKDFKFVNNVSELKNFLEWKQNNTVYRKDYYCVPLSYQLVNLCTNSVVKTQSTAKFSLEECLPPSASKPLSVKLQMKGYYAPGDDWDYDLQGFIILELLGKNKQVQDIKTKEWKIIDAQEKRLAKTEGNKKVLNIESEYELQCDKHFDVASKEDYGIESGPVFNTEGYDIKDLTVLIRHEISENDYNRNYFRGGVRNSSNGNREIRVPLQEFIMGVDDKKNFVRKIATADNEILYLVFNGSTN